MWRSDVMTPLRVALLGAGVIAQSSHLPGWESTPGAQIEWIVDRDLERARYVAERWGVPNATDNPEVAYGHVDAVDICLPPPMHVDAAVQALEANLHVLLEKPLAIDSTGGDTIRRARDRSGRILMVAENWVYASATSTVRALLESGALGRIHLVRAEHLSALYLSDRHPEQPEWLTDPNAAGGGYLLNAGIHTVSLCRDLIGEIAAVFVASRAPELAPNDFDADLVAVVEFESQAIGTFTFSGRSRHTGPRRLAVELFGDRGTVSFDVLSGAVTVSASEPVQELAVPPSMGFAEEIEHFTACVRDGVEPRTGIKDQQTTIAVVEAMYASARTETRIALARAE